MKQTLSDKDRAEIVRYRIENAYKTYDAALALINLNFPISAANRLYYSAYYAVSALLISRGIEARSHTGVRSMLALHFFKTRKLDLKYSYTFNLLFSLRQTGDYEDRKNLDLDADIKPLVEPTKELIDAVSAMAKETENG